MSGKGSKPRPLSVDTKTFSSNWDKIFGKKNEEKENWSHYCVHVGKQELEKGNSCEYCGAEEE